jgi:gluconokinase
MGVAGSGKTTVGLPLAARLGVAFIDADDFHHADAKAKMSRGEPLSDEDRAPWLDRMGASLGADRAGFVLACSALKARYRAVLDAQAGPLFWAWLDARPELIAARLASRTHAYFNPSLAASQFEALEPPEDALRLDAGRPVEELVTAITQALPA